jgi:hypothetical protein
MRFATLADIHERIRLGSPKRGQLQRLTSKEEALFFFEFFYPERARVSTSTAIGKVAHELSLFYDVAANMMPDEETWYALASESNKSASRAMTCQQVLDLPFESMSFTDIAYRFNEVEARLVWRYLMRATPDISKRSFFGIMSTLMDLPSAVVKQSMTRDTLIKMFDDPNSIQSLTEWWKHSAFPTPARWRSWRKLTPPEDDHIAVIVPNGPLYFTWRGEARTRSGERLSSVHANDYLIEWAGDHIIDRIPASDPARAWADRVPDDAETYTLADHGAWENVMRRLNDDDVQCVRLVRASNHYEPDEVMGFTMFPHRSRVFLRLHEIDESRWTLAALDGLDDYEPVARIESPEPTIREVEEDSCAVVEVAVLSVDSEGNINQCLFVDMRPDLGIGDVTQVTELIERGLEHAGD